MLGAYPTAHTDGTSLAGAAWIDLIDPTPAERSAFEDVFGLQVPTKEDLGEIETTSRLQLEQDTLYMTAPLIFAGEGEPWILAPTGFVLSKRVLMTVRFAKSAAFDTVIKELSAAQKFEPAFAYVRILEELVDHMADLLEASGRDLDEASHVIFRQDNSARLSHETTLLRQLMIRTGRTSERMARIHYALVCLDRMAKFTIERCREWIAHDMATRLQSVSSDIASLVQFAEGLVSRVQLLQDAATGIINIDQNEVMKVLTIASVVGIPPVLVVGIYGMNFKNMPELDWAWGYPYALALVLITALLPLLWFKWKDWI
ncbi:MAG TPA: CorA family divalent cation transporter [Beijerinckiaceae bacterium]|nr:CorA family divalent cation transporter [Beijerinckiaceae bacterium]